MGGARVFLMGEGAHGRAKAYIRQTSRTSRGHCSGWEGNWGPLEGKAWVPEASAPCMPPLESPCTKRRDKGLRGGAEVLQCGPRV